MTAMWFKVETYCPLGTQWASDPACAQKRPRAWFYANVAVAKQIAATFQTRWPPQCFTLVACTFWEKMGDGPCPKVYRGPECRSDLVWHAHATHGDLSQCLPVATAPRCCLDRKCPNWGYEWRALYRYRDKLGPAATFLGWVYTDYEGVKAIERGDIRGPATTSSLHAGYRIKTQGNAVV